jgi:ABC-type cobalamin/Fe3+-siderophores transport system ATPase subunit
LPSFLPKLLAGYLDEMTSSFYRRAFIDVVPKEPLEVTINLASTESHTARYGGNTGNSNIFEKSDVVYLTQDHFDAYTADPKKLFGHVLELIFIRLPDQKPKFDAYDRSIEDLLQRIQSINLSIQQLRQETNGQLETERRNLVSTQSLIADFAGQLIGLEGSQGEETANEIRNLTDQIAILRSRIRNIDGILYRLENLLRRIKEFANEFRIEAVEVNERLKNDDLVSATGELSLEFFDVALITNTLGDKVKALTAKSETDNLELSNLVTKVNALEGLSSTLANLQQRRDQAVAESNQIQLRIREIEEKLAKINELNSERQTLYADALLSIKNKLIHMRGAIDLFSKDKNELLEKLDFEGKLECESRKQDYIETLAEKIDNRSHSFADISSKFEALMSNLLQNVNESTSSDDVRSAVKDLMDGASSFRLKGRITESEFYSAVLSIFIELDLDITFDKKTLNSLSMGERAVVLLKIMLAIDDRPLLIDQPENHLDNRYVYNELKPAFRKAKSKRQIIIATHNANLVVNTDADQVIVADNTDGIVTYKSGTLEDKDIRESIKAILEGGDEAFQKREARYGFVF